MLTIVQIMAIVGLLTAFGVDPITTADVQRILEGRPAITSSSTTTTMAPAQPPVSPPTAGNEIPAPTTVAPTSRARIDIINPYPGKGIRDNLSTLASFDEHGNPHNEVYIGAVVYMPDGQPTRSETVVVSVQSPLDATERNGARETKTIVGTGDVTPIYESGQKRVVPVYSFHYEFKAAGEYIFTFAAVNLEQSVTARVTQ